MHSLVLRVLPTSMDRRSLMVFHGLWQLGEELELETLALNGLVKFNREEATVLETSSAGAGWSTTITSSVLEQLLLVALNAPSTD